MIFFICSLLIVGVISQSCNTTCPEGYFNNVTTCACTECVIPQCKICTSQYYCQTCGNGTFIYSGLVDVSNRMVCTKDENAIEISAGLKNSQLGGTLNNEQCKSSSATLYTGTKCVSQAEKDYLDGLEGHHLIYLFGLSLMI